MALRTVTIPPCDTCLATWPLPQKCDHKKAEYAYWRAAIQSFGIAAALLPLPVSLKQMAFVQSVLKDLNDAWQDSSAELSKLLLLVGRGVLASFAHFAAEKSWESVAMTRLTKRLTNTGTWP